MPKLKKAQAAILANLEKRKSAAADAVYGSQFPRRDIPFSECLKAAPEAIAARYEQAVTAHVGFQCAMVEQGRGYWDDRGIFRPHA